MHVTTVQETLLQKNWISNFSAEVCRPICVQYPGEQIIIMTTAPEPFSPYSNLNHIIQAKHSFIM
jgi:hypothetical protein